MQLQEEAIATPMYSIHVTMTKRHTYTNSEK